VEPVKCIAYFFPELLGFLLTGYFYVVFSFSVHGNVVVEIFKRALRPSFGLIWFRLEKHHFTGLFF